MDELTQLRVKIALEYKEAIDESNREPFPSTHLNKEHRIIWRGHANAYSEVLSEIDNLAKVKKHEPPPMTDEEIAEHAVVCWPALEPHEQRSFRLVVEARDKAWRRE